MDTIPEALAKKADARAWEIFQQEANMGHPFRECLGQIYMVAVKAAMEHAAPQGSAKASS